MTQRIREMMNGSLLTGEEHSGPAMEYATLHHTLPDGSVMSETVIRSVETPAPDGPPEAQPAQGKTTAGGD